MNEKIFDLISIGNISIDVIRIGNKKITAPGGSAAAVSTAAATFNLRCGLVSQIGRDFPTEWLLDLASRGIDIRGIKKQDSSCKFELTYDESGALVKFSESNTCETGLSVRDIPDEYKSSKHFHLSAAHPANQSRFLKTLSEANNGSTISLTLWPSYEKEYNENFVEMLDKVHILFCNDVEARILAKEENIYDAVKKIKKQGPDIIVLTKGAKGSAIYNKGEFFLFPALRTNIVDRTGCGDNFAGGFLANYLQTADIERAGWAGTALASFKLSKYGAWFPEEVNNGKIEERMETAKEYYKKKNREKITLMDFF